MPTFQNFQYSFLKLKAGIPIFACEGPLPVQPEQVDEKKFPEWLQVIRVKRSAPDWDLFAVALCLCIQISSCFQC